MLLNTKRAEYNWRTEDADPGIRLGEWSQMLTREFVELESSLGQTCSFAGRIWGCDLANVRFSEMEAEAQTVVHSAAAAAREAERVFKLCLQTEANGRYKQCGREVILSPGDLTLLDTGRAYEATFDAAFALIIIQVPPELMSQYVRSPEEFLARSVTCQSGMGAVLSAYVQMIARMIAVLSLNDQRLVVAHMLELVALSLGAATGMSSTPTRQDVRNRQIRAAKSFIEKNIRDHALNGEMIARATGMSERYLRALFQAQSTSITKYIINRRMEMCWSTLQSEHARDYSIQQIALSSGFRDYSYFTTKFKERYGVSPSFVRQNRN